MNVTVPQYCMILQCKIGNPVFKTAYPNYILFQRLKRQAVVEEAVDAGPVCQIGFSNGTLIFNATSVEDGNSTGLLYISYVEFVYNRFRIMLLDSILLYMAWMADMDRDCSNKPLYDAK